jgi:hypothetical protein
MLFESIALFATRVVYRAALDRSDPRALAEASSDAEDTAALLDELAMAARFAPPGIPIDFPPFGTSDTSCAPSRAAVAAATLRSRLLELRNAAGAGNPARLLLNALRSAP